MRYIKFVWVHDPVTKFRCSFFPFRVKQLLGKVNKLFIAFSPRQSQVDVKIKMI